MIPAGETPFAQDKVFGYRSSNPSSDLATESLQIKRAMILGQVIAGVPVWKALAGSKFPGTPFIVFPGNVGAHTALDQIIQQLHP